MRILNTKGVSLVEIVLAGLIFVIAIMGVFTTMAKTRGPVATSDKSLSAAVWGQQMLESLRTEVSASTYDTGALSLGCHSGTTPYSYNYSVVCADNTSAPDPCVTPPTAPIPACTMARKVKLTITW